MKQRVRLSRTHPYNLYRSDRIMKTYALILVIALISTGVLIRMALPMVDATVVRISTVLAAPK